jgi:hypothetical protein
MNEHLMQRVEALAGENALLLLRLKDTTRMLEAVRYTAGLHGNQIDRLKLAQAVIAEIEAEGRQP